MIELEMHWTSGYYLDETFIPSHIDPRCHDCPYMPDKECGWGYQHVNECVFQIEKGKPYWYDAYDTCLNERFKNTYLTPESDIDTLVNFLDLASSLHIVVTDWNWESQRDEFLDETYVLRTKVREYGYEIKTGQDYVMWSYSKEPCACCGNITKDFVLHGKPKWFGSKKEEGNVIKLCEHCADSEWISTYVR